MSGIRVYVRLVRDSDGRPLTTWGSGWIDWCGPLALSPGEPVRVEGLGREEHWSLGGRRVLCKLELADNTFHHWGYSKPFEAEPLVGDIDLVVDPLNPLVRVGSETSKIFGPGWAKEQEEGR